MRRLTLTRSFAVRTLGLFAAFFLVSCFGDSTGPGELRRARLAVTPVFDSRALLLVDFNRVRIQLLRPGTTPVQVALDTTIDFPSSVDTVRLPLTVPLQAGASSEQFDLTLAMIDAAGNVVFRGGPIRVTAVAGPVGGQAPDVPMVYVGVGANAAGVRFVTAPATAFFGDTAVFAAEAYDASGQAIRGTPIVYWVDPQDTSLAFVPDPAVGRVVAKSRRGSARVIAELLTHQTATATLKVQPQPAAIAITGGNAQSGMAGTVLAQPLAVRVKAADSLGVEGVVVTFSVTSGGGSVTTANVTTDALGFASTTVTLGATVGAQSFRASAGGAGQVTFSATATPAGGVPTSIAINAGNGQSATVGTAVPVLPSVIVLDGLNAPVSGVSVTFAVASGGGSITGAAATTNASGIATIGSWTLGTTPGTNTLTASVAGLAPVTFTATGIANSITLQPNVTVQAGQSASLGITLSSAAPAGGLAVTLASSDTTKLKVTTPTVNIAAGQTTGSATLLGVAAGTVTVTATAPGYTGGATTVSVTGVPAALTLVLGGNQIASPSTQLPQPVVVLVTDAVGNPVAGFPVTFAVATGGGSVGTPSATTNASGQASTTWTLGAAAGTQTITVTASGLAGSPLTVAANAPVIASTTVSPQRDTLTAIGATRTLVAQAKDASGNNLTGSFTWVSRTPAVATVGITGVVRAVTNGSTYVVATEAGGTKDSALIVVQQSLATINVVPGTRSIYLTRNFTFTASAADGGGTPLPSQPTFTWTSTAPAVATVNSAGLVTAVGLGSTQIRATSGTVIGVANVSVITPITRIAVVVDTVGAFKTDTFTLTSLGLPRHYRAIAHDTLDAVMTGVSFSWVSTNGSVAVLSNPAGDTTTATSAANGLTQILATAQGFTSAPGALLTVSQVLASIQLTPDASNPTATIGITGTVHVSARGKDANNRYIPGGTFAYASATPAVATVDAVTGVVTGVSLGTSAITATSGAVTSNVVTVAVSTTVPSIISFGRDTVSVGRGSNASIPILLSTPAASPLTVNLSAAAFAHWSTASVTISAGQTAINATLVGDSAGTTVVTATDGSGLGYAAGSAVAKVTANMRLTSGGYAILANDIVQTQVLLSDPSPAGGTYVTFNYSTPGIAAISPDPAFIPAGQLAADIQIRGLAAGSTTITPSAIGVNGAASSFTAYPPVIYPSTGFVRLGQGQFDQYYYVYTQISTNVPIPVTLTSSDTNVVRPSPLVVTIPGGSNYAYFNVAAKATGAATISLSSPGWTAQSSISVVATSPYVGICCGYNLLTTSPQTNVTVYAEDSLRTAHYRTNSLLVHLRSSDSTVIKVLDSVVTIGAGQYYTSAGRIIPGGTGGQAYVVATASGHVSDSTQYTVTGPSLYFSWGTNRIGAGQEDYYLYVYAQNNVTAPLVVTLANPDSNILGLPATVTIPANQNYVYFTARGKTPGSVTLTASAPGYQSVNATYIVTTPRVTISGGYTINNFAPARTYYAYATDSLGNGHYRTAPLTVAFSSSDTNVVKTDTIGTIPAGQYYTYTTSPQLTPVGVGTAQILASAAGHRADSTTYTIVTPKLNLSWYAYMIGRRQHRNPTDFYVYTPDSRPVTVPVTLTQKNTVVESLTTTAPTIQAGINYVYFSFYGLSNGVDTIIASATGYQPDTAFVTVTSPRLTSSGLPGGTTTTNPPIGMYVYATDSLGNGHYTSDTVVVRAVSSDTTVIQPTQPFFRILKNDYYAYTTVTIVGPGTASITYSDSALTGYAPITTNTITVTGPSLFLANGSPVLGMRQHGGTNSSYVYTQNNVATPLVVNLLATDVRVASVPATVTIPAGLNYAYFDVTALDTVGTIQIQATATGYGATSMTVRVTRPKFVVSTSGQVNTTSAPQNIYVYAADSINGTPHYTTEDVVVTLVSSSPSVAAIDSSTVTIVNGNYYNNNARWSPGIEGTASIQASDGRAVQYAYAAGTQGVRVATPSLSFSWGSETLGLGQYIDEYVYRPDYPAVPLDVALSHTGTARVETWVGGAPVSSVQIPASQNYVYFRVVGTSTGRDTLVATATSPAHNPATAYTAVGQGRIDPINYWPTTLAFGDSVQVLLYTRDPAQNARYVSAATVFTPTLTNLEFWTGGANSTKLTTVTVPADLYYVYFWVKATGHGTGSATITATNYATYTNTVTIP